MSFILCISALLLFPLVQAHGTVNKLVIGGKAYTGSIPLQAGVAPSTKPSILRQISTGEPIMDAKDSGMSCGENSHLATLAASANPGDKVELNWAGEDGISTWPHDVGPMFVYLADCGGDCKNFDSSKAKWFKIAQSGQKSDGSWGQAVLKASQPYVYNLPSNIAPGNYLLRNEAVNMARETAGLVEIYPACAQLKIGGSGSGKPAAGDLVSFPGAYKTSDFLNFDPYTPSDKKFSMPGPAIASFISGKAPANPPAGGNGDSPSKASSSSSKIHKTRTSTATKPTGTSKPRKCSVKRSVRRSEAAIVNATIPDTTPLSDLPLQPASYAGYHRSRHGTKLSARHL